MTRYLDHYPDCIGCPVSKYCGTQCMSTRLCNSYGQKPMKILYTCQLVNDQEALKAKYPSSLPNKYYHHSTNKFKPKGYCGKEGEPLTLHIIGRLTTDKIDCLVVENPNSINEIPHITLATAEEVKPFYSNIALKEHPEDIVPLDDYVETTFRNITA